MHGAQAGAHFGRFTSGAGHSVGNIVVFEIQKDIPLQIMQAANDRYALKKRALRGKQFTYHNWTYEATVEPLLTWVKSPHHALDVKERFQQNGNPLNSVDELWLNWGFPENANKKQSRPYKPVTHIRPGGKNWFQRLWGK